ncbi:MAG: hypothetical protein ICV68_12420 [Pyrinomonadaceae bacterium]|nr:hypothetical protein [Pyrinomonadaceae bacterium]
MSKHKKVDDRSKVGKAGAPASGTENEKPVDEKAEPESLPKVNKKDVGGGDGGGLH